MKGLEPISAKPGSRRKAAVLLAPFFLGLPALHAQPAPFHTHIKRVIVYDFAPPGEHVASRAAFRQSMGLLAQQYRFQLDTTREPADITTAYLSGAQILVANDGDGDVFTAAGSKQAVQDFVEKDGHGILMIHSAGEVVPCPTAGLENLSDPDCQFLARVAVRQYLSHNIDPTTATVYVDSVAKGQIPPYAITGTPAVAFDHGIKSDETRSIFTGLPRSFPGLRDEWFSFRDSPRLQGDMTIGGEIEGRVNVLLSIEESSYVPANKTGDHPIAWTRKMGNGLGAFNSSGHRAAAGDEIFFQQDSVIHRFNWQLMRYLAKDFMGCMDPNFAEYNPEATVTALTPGDPANPCLTPTTVIKAGLGRGDFSTSAGPRVISISFNSIGKQTVKVVDVHGKAVFATTVMDRSELMVPGLRSGIYFVTVSSATKRTVRKVNLF